VKPDARIGKPVFKFNLKKVGYILFISSIMQDFIQRTQRLAEIRQGLAAAPIVALLGPRQCGKTTLALASTPVASGAKHYDLEDPAHLIQIEEGMEFFTRAQGVIIIDEIQRLPSLFPRLRVWADRKTPGTRFLITGSASFELIRGVSESLAGRVRLIRMNGFTLQETGASVTGTLWLRGGFPRSFLAASAGESWLWRRDFVETFLTRDLPSVAEIRHPAAIMRRFWTMLAHYHGQTWNAKEAAGSLGLDVATVNRYLSLMEDTFMVRTLPPWTENVGKRLRKAPKIYMRDSGVAHYLLNLRTEEQLLSHPKCGASWEGFVIEQVLSQLDDPSRAYYWATHGGAELDLLLDLGDRRIGFEIKRSSAPSSTKSMHSAMEDLRLNYLYVIHPGQDRYRLAENIEALPLNELEAEVLNWQV